MDRIAQHPPTMREFEDLKNRVALIEQLLFVMLKKSGNIPEKEPTSI